MAAFREELATESDPDTTKKIEALIDALGLRVEDSAAIKGNMDPDEDKSVLKDVSDFLGTQPRLTWNAVWLLATRP
jgi:hypothetical protein